jgi:hypothetical protein
MARPTSSSPATTELLLDVLEQAFSRRSWHGTNLRGSLRRLAPEVAAWRPAAGRHNAWEIALHCAYWKYAVWRRLTGEKRGSFPLEGSNWFRRPQPPTDSSSQLAWKVDVRLLADMHERLIGAVRVFAPAIWEERAPASPFRYRDLVMGAAAHDLYHAGQIQLLKRLAAKESS